MWRIEGDVGLGVSLSVLLRQAMARTGARWTPSSADAERALAHEVERGTVVDEVARIGNNLQQDLALGERAQVVGRRRRGARAPGGDRAGAAEPVPAESAEGVMHLKFLARGTGSAAVAAAYLLALKDAAGKARAAVEVLRGDPMLVAAIADGLPFKHRYTSGVMAWSPEDAPTQPEIERVIDEFEKTAWAGLDPDRYVWAVVLHRDDDGGVHVHLFAARCDLATGLSLNIAPPGWERTFDPLRDAFNYEHGWSRPDDPSRARSFRPAPHLAHQARLARRAGEDVEPDVRHEIGMHLLELVAAGRVKDRAGVVAVLEERGYDVPRQGDHYLTARDRETGERWRLKGALYERDFDRERFLREAPAPSADRERADGDAAPAAAARKAVEKAQRRRADYNRAYYGRGHRPGRDGVQAAGGDGEVARESGPAAGRSAGHDASLAAHLERELGGGAVAADAGAAEPARARRAAAGEGRGERSLASADALAEAAHAAGPDLSRALDEHVAVRERAVCATSMGEQWLAGAQQEVLVEEEDRRLTVGERTRAVETVEGRLETDLSRREADLTATTSGPVLLQEAFGERREGDAPLSFSAWERGLDGVEQRVDEELRTQEEALRAIPPGKRYLSEAEQVRAAAAGPPARAERESRVRAVAQQVGEELDRREEELLAIISGDALLVEAADALFGDGRTRSLGERWEACEGATSGVEEELDRREAAILTNPAAEEFLRDVRLEVLGAADREAATFGDRARIVKVAAEAKRDAEEERQAAALRTATEATHAAAALSDVKFPAAEVRAIYDETGATHEEGLAALERTAKTLGAAAAQQLPRETIVETWKANQSAPGGIAAALEAVTAAAREEQKRKEEAEEAEKAAAIRTATERAQAAAARSDVQLHDAEVRAIHATGETHESGLAAVERTTAALGAAADHQLPTQTIVETWKANQSDPDGIAAALEAVTAAAREEQKRKEEAEEAEKAAAIRTATERAQAAAARSDVQLHDAEVRAIHATGETHESGLAAVERTTAALGAAADHQLPTQTIVETWNANDSAPGGIAAALEAVTAAAREEQKRKEEAEKAAAIRTATERAQAAAARSDVQLHDAEVRAIHATGETHESGLAAVERTTAALGAAADHQLPTQTIVETWNANDSALGGIAAALEAVTAAAREEQKRKEEAEKAAAIRTATERAQAAAARSDVQLHDAEVRAIHATGETHESGLAAVERTTAALGAAADHQLPTQTIVETWNANDSAPGGIAAALEAVTAAAREEQKRKEEAEEAEKAAAIRTATEATHAAAALSDVKFPAAEVRAIYYKTGATHEEGLSALKRTTEALGAAADQQLPAETIVETWKANRSAPGGIAAALKAVTAAAREEEERKAAAIRTATEATHAAAALSDVKFPAAEVRAIYYKTGATHEEGLSALKRTTEALGAAADQQLPAETIVETWKANRSAPGGIAAALKAVTAAAREEEERKAAAIRTATEATHAAAALSDVKFPAAEVRAIYYKTGATHEEGLSALKRTTEALGAAADQQLPAETIVETWKANRSAPGGIAAALDAARREERRQAAERQAADDKKQREEPQDLTAAAAAAPPPKPTLEKRYRERFPTHADDVRRPQWSTAKDLDEEHRRRMGSGTRSNLDYEYRDCFRRPDMSSRFTWPPRKEDQSLPHLPHVLQDTSDPPPGQRAGPAAGYRPVRELAAQWLPRRLEQARHRGPSPRRPLRSSGSAAPNGTPTRSAMSAVPPPGRSRRRCARIARAGSSCSISSTASTRCGTGEKQQEEERAKAPLEAEVRTQDRRRSQDRGRSDDLLR